MDFELSPEQQEVMKIVVARELMGRESLPYGDRSAPPSRPVAAP